MAFSGWWTGRRGQPSATWPASDWGTRGKGKRRGDQLQRSGVRIMDRAGRNVAALVKTPQGRSGRPSKSFTLDEAKALLVAAEGTRMQIGRASCRESG